MSTQPFNSDGGFSTTANVATGNVTLSSGGVIHETAIPGGTLSGNTIALAPAGNTSADQQLLIYPTSGPTADDNHLHLTSGNLYNTELFLGNDNLYVKLANTGDILINSNDDGGNTAQWIFGTDANLSVPGNTLIYTPIATGGAGGKNISIQAGSSDSFSATPGGNLNLTGGYGSFGDGGGPPGGNVNITSGGSQDSHAGNVNINTGGANTWNFAYTGNLTLPSDVVVMPGYPGYGYIADTAALVGAQVYLASPSGNAYVGVENGTPLIASTPDTVWAFGTDGNLTTPGSSGNITGANLISAVRFSATGNITAGNVLLVGNIGPALIASPAPSINGFDSINSLTLNATGNITGGNANISGTTTSTSKTTGALIVGGGVGISGNIYSGRSVTQGAYGNIILNEYTGIYNQKDSGTAVIQTTSNALAAGVGILTAGGSDRSTQLYSTGNLTIKIGVTTRAEDVPTGGTSVATVTANGINVTGLASASGNVTGGNILTGGLISATSSTNTLNLVTRNGDPNPFNTRAQITFGYNGTTDYPQFVHTVHNAGTAVDNKIEFWTSDGAQTGTFPANAILGGSITQGAMQLAVYASTTARDSVITTPAPGMMIYVTGTGMQVRGATSWNTIAGSGS